MILSRKIMFLNSEQSHENVHQPTNHKSTFFLNVLLIGLVLISHGVYMSHGACNQLDRDSLSSFNHSISSSSDHPLQWSVSVDCCRWDGVGCDKSGRVISLSLPSRGLKGTISPSVSNLTSLTHLYLPHNGLSGPIPNGFFMSLSWLEVIDLSHNSLPGDLPLSDNLGAAIKIFNISNNLFNGTVPSSFLQFASNVESFNISSNSFVGSIPSNVCKFSLSIKWLDYSENDFSGSILQGLGQCTRLQSIRAGFCNISGEIPMDIYTLSNLQELYLPGNKITGNIHESIANLKHLRILALFENQLTGIIPPNIGSLSELEHLQLYTNQLNGTIPPSLANCTKLTTLSLRSNSLHGQLSAFDFSKFGQLLSIDLAINYFQGGLPPSLFQCKTLIAIRLAANNLNGPILPDIVSLQSLSFLSLSENNLTNSTSAITILSRCKSLTTLLLSENFFNEPFPAGNNEMLIGFRNLKVFSMGFCRLTGQIPNWLSKLQNLEVLYLSNNSITGSIPVWLRDLPNLFYIDFSHNLLSGPFPMELTTLPRLASIQPNANQAQTNFPLPVFHKSYYNSFGLQYSQLSNIPRAIRLSNNHISGSIPKEIGHLKFIIELDLSDNNLSGKIPDTISHLIYLEKLNLSWNHLSGEIPASLKNLNFLSEFSVANNNLEGLIPTGGQFDTFSISSFQGNRGLCGGIVQVPCISKAVGEEDAQTEEAEGGYINWVSFAIGFGVSFIIAEIVALKVFNLCGPERR